MRFDPDRALALARTFDTLRLAGSDAERAAADRLAGEISRAGWTVHKGEMTGPRTDEPSAAETWTLALVAIISGVLLQLIAGATPGPIDPWTLAAIFGALATTALILRLVVSGQRRELYPPSQFVYAGPAPAAATRPGEAANATTRVVFLTHLDTRPPMASLRFRRDLGFLDMVWLAALLVPCLINGAAWLSAAGPALLIGLGLITLARRIDPWVQRTEAYPADNRTGLALMIELARTWPLDTRHDSEVRFLAIGAAPSPRMSIIRDLIDADAPHEVPTLVVNLEAPGVGDLIWLSGEGKALRLATHAARDLWLPARAGSWRLASLDHRSIEHALPAVSLVGDLEATSIQLNLLAATAQLATEIALRWSRHGGLQHVEEKTSS